MGTHGGQQDRGRWSDRAQAEGGRARACGVFRLELRCASSARGSASPRRPASAGVSSAARPRAAPAHGALSSGAGSAPARRASARAASAANRLRAACARALAAGQRPAFGTCNAWHLCLRAASPQRRPDEQPRGGAYLPLLGSRFTRAPAPPAACMRPDARGATYRTSKISMLRGARCTPKAAARNRCTHHGDPSALQQRPGPGSPSALRPRGHAARRRPARRPTSRPQPRGRRRAARLVHVAVAAQDQEGRPAVRALRALGAPGARARGGRAAERHAVGRRELLHRGRAGRRRAGAAL